MWIVRLALDRPYTFVVLALLILLLGIGAAVTTPIDIFPKIDIPVVSIIWTYNGLTTPEMERRVTTFSEFVLATVNDIKSIESQTLDGVSVIKVYFQPQVRIDAATAQINSAVNGIRFRMPPGINPPWIVRFGADTVPVIQLALSSDTLTESELYDYGLFRIRQQLSTVAGTLLPTPYGGKVRQIMVDLDQDALNANNLSPIDISNAINNQNVTLPSGTVKIGSREYTVSTNSSPSDFSKLNDVPVKFVNGATVFMRDVAHVRDGDAVQQNVVRADGKPSVLLTIMKTGSVSTLSIVNEIKNRILPAARASAPKGMEIKELFDQSVFVRGSINGVLREAVIAACLTGLMILLFLGSWRSTLIIAVSIPLSILSSLCVLSALGHTMNVMTLGGLALAIGILVDDATVTIENIHRHMGRKPLHEAVLEGAAQIAAPTLVSTLTICIVFVSVLFLTGPAKFLFTPMALAVVFAMLASYLLSRTLVPVMSAFLLKGEQHEVDPATGVSAAPAHSKNWFNRVNEKFNDGYILVRTRYTELLRTFLAQRKMSFVLTAILIGSAFVLMPFVGRDFFPNVDAGQIRLHVRAATGTRLENTKIIFSRVEEEIRRVIPADETELVLDDIGRPAETFNLAFGDGATIGAFDGEILVALKEGKHGPTAKYVAELRKRLPRVFPTLLFYFQPADIVTQILNFGLPAPIDVQVAGYDPGNYDIARRMRDKIALVPGVVDSHVHQVMDGPDLHYEIDRSRAAEFGLTAQDISNSMFVSLSSSTQVQPNFFLDPRDGNHVLRCGADSAVSLRHGRESGKHAHSRETGGQAQLLSNLAAVSHSVQPVVANHRDVQPVFDVYANVQDSDLGSVANKIDRIVKEFKPQLSPGSDIVMRGQVESMREAFSHLGLGLVFAALLVYLLMVVNFQSWTDPFIIITALPGAFTGVVWALFLTQSTFSVPSMMGAIMSIGVATANSILLVTFASERMELGRSSVEAAVDAGCTRLRPIIMTALAMVIGMLPMALGLGEGGEQNAPLARAVIGGLSLATLATLFFVPLMFSILRHTPPGPQERIP